MAMGKTRADGQGELWVATKDLAATPGHPFYVRLNKLLEKHGFDKTAEDACRPYYAESVGRPSIPPGVYFRMLMIGYFEGLDSERGICWKVADSRSLGAFLGYRLTEETPTHVTLGNTRKRLPVEVHRAVFTSVLAMLAKEGLLKGHTLGVDATTLEANAALRSIVRKDTGDDYQEYLKKLAVASGIETPTKEELIRFDRSRKGKKMSNDDWKHPHDPDARIGMTKQGACDMIHKCETATDLDSGAVVCVTLHHGDLGDTTTVEPTLATAAANLDAAGDSDIDALLALPVLPASEVVADKGYHSNASLKHLDSELVRTYISEPERGRRNWEGKEIERDLVYANRRRIRGERGKRLFRLRAELCERGFAHLFTTGGMRRTYLRGHSNILKRLLIHTCGFNLGLVMRKLFGKGTPKGLHDLFVGCLTCFSTHIADLFRITVAATLFSASPSIFSSCAKRGGYRLETTKAAFFIGLIDQQEGRKKFFNDEVAKRFAAELEKGESPMQRHGVPVFPYNPANGRAFHGINALSLMLQNRADDRWLAWDEAKMAGLRIKDKEKPTPVQKWLPPREGEDGPRSITTWYYNGEQLLGMPPMPRKPERPDPMDRVLDFLKHSGAGLAYDREHRGYYSKRDDTIHLANPEKAGRDQFCEDALFQYFKSLGHPSRLDRAETFNAAGRGKEAQEELICGFATVSMCAELGIPIQPARYADLAGIWQGQMVARPLDFARDIRAADDMVKITLEREHARKVELNPNETELWRATPEEFPHGAVRTFLDRKQVLDDIENLPDALDKFMLGDKEIFAIKESGYTLDKKDLNPEVPETEYALLIKTQGFDRDGNPHDILVSYDIRLNDMGTIEHRSEPEARSIRAIDRTMSLPRDWSGHLQMQGYRTNGDGEPEKTNVPEYYTVLGKRENGEPEPVASFDRQRDAIKYMHQVNRQFEYQGKQRGIDFDFDLLKNPDRDFQASRQESDRPLGERDAENGQSPGEAKKQVLPAMEPTEETRAECIVAMEAVGMNVTGNHPIFDGKGHRIDVEGDKPRQGSGWYIAFSNGRPSGVCVNNRTNVRTDWSKSRGYKLTENKKRELNSIAQAKKTTYQKERDAKQEAAIAKLHGMIEKTFVKPTEPTPYLQSKMLPMDPGIYQNKGSTCIPIHDLDGNIQSMAYIQANGAKRYAKDCDKNGGMYVFGGVEKLGNAKAFVVGEGYSTVASAHHATSDMGVASIAGFDSANTKAVIGTLREQFPDTPIINLGDDDKHLELKDPPLPNRGRQDAEETAKTVSGVTAVFPTWPEGTPVDKDHTDFDDLRRMNTPGKDNVREGFEAVRSQLRPVIERAIELAQENKQEHQHEKTRGSLARG